MSDVFVRVPEEISEKMRKHDMINWGEVVSRELSHAVSEREMVEQILQDSRLTPKDVEELDAEIKKSLTKRYEKT